MIERLKRGGQLAARDQVRDLGGSTQRGNGGDSFWDIVGRLFGFSDGGYWVNNGAGNYTRYGSQTLAFYAASDYVDRFGLWGNNGNAASFEASALAFAAKTGLPVPLRDVTVTGNQSSWMHGGGGAGGWYKVTTFWMEENGYKDANGNFIKDNYYYSTYGYDTEMVYLTEGELYQKMWNMSFDAKGKVLQETAAFLTNDKVLLLPTEGKRQNTGEYGKNGPRVSYWDYIPWRFTDNGKFQIKWAGVWTDVNAYIHTHPNKQTFGDYEVVSDKEVQEFLGIPVLLIRTNGFYSVEGLVYGTQSEFFQNKKSMINIIMNEKK